MEIKIGVQDSPREIVIESDQSPNEVSAAVRAAIASGEVLELTDTKDRTVVVPAAKITYVEIVPVTRGRVGFGSTA